MKGHGHVSAVDFVVRTEERWDSSAFVDAPFAEAYADRELHMACASSVHESAGLQASPEVDDLPYPDENAYTSSAHPSGTSRMDMAFPVEVEPYPDAVVGLAAARIVA